MQPDPQAMTLVAGRLPTKSAKIRALAKAGYARADIARFLGIRYQHVRNVLTQEAPRADESLQRKSAAPAALGAERPEWSVEIMRGNLEPDPDGSLRVPVGFLNGAGIEPGEKVLARVVDGEIRLSGYAAALKRAQWIAQRFHQPGRSEVDDFIAERRALGARGE